MNLLLKPVLLLRGMLVTAYFLPHTIISAIVVLVLSTRKSWKAYTDWAISTLWAKPILFLTGTEVELRGAENWPRGRGFLILFNHTSWVDIIVLAAELPGVPRFGAKIELYSIPFFGRAMRNVGMLPIERNNRTKVLQVYREAEARAANGEFFALAPEGTRQADRTLGRFKQGPFLFAVGAQMPLLPVVIAGAREVMPKASWLLNPWSWRRKVLVEILPAIYTEGFNESHVPALQGQVKQMMEPVYERLKAELGQVDAPPMMAAASFENYPPSS